MNSGKQKHSACNGACLFAKMASLRVGYAHLHNGTVPMYLRSPSDDHLLYLQKMTARPRLTWNGFTFKGAHDAARP